MKKKITTTRMMTLIIALVIILPQTILAFSGSGSGTEVDPYIITDVDQLQEMNNELDAWYELGNNIDASGTSGWNGGAGFVPIGNGSNKFTGHFDGKGHTITGLFVNRNADDKGLFGYTDSGSEVKNVGLIDFNITGSGGSHNGCLIGFSYSDVTNCYSAGSVEASSNHSGGLIGLNCAPITNCYSRADLNNSYSYVGGLVGRNYATTVTNCYSAGHVDGDKWNIGGCIGENFSGGTSPNCFWDIETSGQATSAGGIGKTTMEMKTKSTFTDAGWDFGNIWNILETVNNGYPFLIPVNDTISPSSVTDLQVIDSTVVTLEWTAPADNYELGLSLYDIRYSTSFIDESNWADADQCDDEPNPQAAGSIETFIVNDLLPSTHYYFALKSADLASNWSDISNCVDVTTPAYYDDTPPAHVTDLQVINSSCFFFTLQWTATGDDSTYGTASFYDIRYGMLPINDNNWDEANQCTGEPVPQESGSIEVFTSIDYDMFENTTYYFSLKTADEQLNWSDISNCASGTTMLSTQMELSYDDLQYEGNVDAGTYFVRFPQYYEVPYEVSGFTILSSGGGTMSLYPDDGSGLPDTTTLLGTTSFSGSASWKHHPLDNDIGINSPGNIWLCIDSNDNFKYDNSSPDGNSYIYSNGEYYQYDDRDLMVRLDLKGEALEHDVLIESNEKDHTADNPDRYIAPAAHSVVPRVTVRNAGSTIETFSTYCIIDYAGTNIYSDIVTVNNLEPDSTFSVSFNPWSVGEENSIYQMTVYTALSGDLCSFNDTLSIPLTASYTEELTYDLDMWSASYVVIPIGGHYPDVLARVTPSAYPAQITELKFKFNWQQSPPNHPLDLRVYSDVNPSDFYNFEPGELIWNGIFSTNGTGPGWRIYNISDSNVIITESDGEAYVGYTYIQNLNVMTDANSYYCYPERFGTFFGGTIQTIEMNQDYFMRATMVYTSTTPPSPPENVNIEIIADGDSVRISWNNEGFSYNIYSSDNPYATFPDEWGSPLATVFNVGEVTLPASGNKKFYCVTAENAKSKVNKFTIRKIE